MAMEITSNYSNYAANYADTTKKSSSNVATEAKTNTSTSSKDKVQEYYEQLCNKFPQININTSGGIASGNKNNIVLNLSNDCLKKWQVIQTLQKKSKMTLRAYQRHMSRCLLKQKVMALRYMVLL